jgi:hypothetical protein
MHESVVGSLAVLRRRCKRRVGFAIKGSRNALPCATISIGTSLQSGFICKSSVELHLPIFSVPNQATFLPFVPLDACKCCRWSIRIVSTTSAGYARRIPYNAESAYCSVKLNAQERLDAPLTLLQTDACTLAASLASTVYERVGDGSNRAP